MASLYVTEYASVVGASGTAKSDVAYPAPALASQKITIAGTAAALGNALNAATKMVSITADAAACIAVGVGAVAVNTGQLIPANGAPVRFAVTSDMTVSCITP